MIHLTPEQEDELFAEYEAYDDICRADTSLDDAATDVELWTDPAPIEEQARVIQALAPKTIPYTMAAQHCLMCNTEIPFVPFKDPICSTCCQPVEPYPEPPVYDLNEACKGCSDPMCPHC